MKFNARNGQELPSFQIAPMIDIVFLLLCFFMATVVYAQWEREVDIVLPSAQSGEVPDRLPGEIIINLDAEGGITINQQSLDLDSLSNLLNKLSLLFEGQPVILRADATTRYKDLMAVMDACRMSDIYNISFATQEPENNP